MAVATDRELGLLIADEVAEPASGEIRELTEPASVIVSTGARPINPFER